MSGQGPHQTPPPMAPPLSRYSSRPPSYTPYQPHPHPHPYQPPQPSSQQDMYRGTNALPTSSQQPGNLSRPVSASTMHQQQQQASSGPQQSRASLFSFHAPVGAPKRLHRKNEEELYDDMAAIFSIITATERLENMRVRRSAIHQDEYEQQCSILLGQYQEIRERTGNTIPDLDTFIAQYQCGASLARERIKKGEPATHKVVTTGNSKALAKCASTCTDLLNSLVNYIQMEQTAVSYLLPQLTTLTKNLDAIKRMVNISVDEVDLSKGLVDWAERLNHMQPHMQLSVEDSAKFEMDLQNCNEQLKRILD